MLAHGLFSLHADGVCLSIQNGGAQAHGISNGGVNVVRLHTQWFTTEGFVNEQRIALDIRQFGKIEAVVDILLSPASEAG